MGVLIDCMTSRSFELETTSAYVKKRPATVVDNGAVDDEVKTCGHAQQSPAGHGRRCHADARRSGARMIPKHRLLMERKLPWKALSLR
jgi:hypothetical protein